MVKLIRKCPGCGRYTLKELCPNCGKETHHAIPPKFSPEDRYGAYRRALKLGKEDWDEGDTDHHIGEAKA
ncbi:MAG: RNA-protein complex protein Nop10 [Methanobacteriota archaeon]|nr:MAG: RNA-protein complex protein Nop10 [Euryarchaeota archaeon]